MYILYLSMVDILYEVVFWNITCVNPLRFFDHQTKTGTSRENEAYSALLVLMEQIACLHVDVLSLPSQGRQTMKLLWAALLLGSDKEKKGMGRKYMGARILFIASYHTALLQRQAPVWEPNLVVHTVSGLLNFISYPR